MAKFLFIYRNSRESYESISPDEMPRIYEKWRSWIASGFQQGWILDAGSPLSTEGRVVNTKQMVTDGPFAETKEVVGGYTIVQAESLDAAAEHAKGCPVLVRGGTVEVRPLREFAATK